MTAGAASCLIGDGNPTNSLSNLTVCVELAQRGADLLLKSVACIAKIAQHFTRGHNRKHETNSEKNLCPSLRFGTFTFRGKSISLEVL